MIVLGMIIVAFISGIVTGICICSMFVEYEKKSNDDYLKDIIYCVTQYLLISDKEVAILNDRLFKAISKRIWSK